MATTSDTGRLAERVASIDPAEFHGAVQAAAVAALRDGAPVELLDGVEFWRMSDLNARVTDTRGRRIAMLGEELADARRAYDQARRNANSTTNEKLRADYLADSEREADRITALEADLASAEAQPDSAATPDAFDSDCDFLAHALAGLTVHGEHAPAEYVDALSRVIEFDAFTPIHTTDPPQVEVTFHLLLPADGRVARFGPITCRVQNRAYRNTLRDNGETQRARALMHQRLRQEGHADLDAAPHRAVDSLRDLLVTQLGWTRHAARTLATSGVGALYDIAAHLLWGDPLPAGLDPAYVELVTTTYQDPGFRWNPHRHALDCTLRQTAVDAVVAAGGHLGFTELETALTNTTVDDVRITVFSRDQTIGNGPTWHPCLERRGDWIQQHPKSGRSLAAATCPHCNGFASRVVRTPETPADLLCPTCHRMPTTDSPTYPDTYLTL